MDAATVPARAGLAALALVLCVTASAMSAAFAQGLPGCSATRAGDPPRRVMDCGGTIVEWEAAAAMGIVPKDGGGTVLLDGGAVLVDAEPGGQDFQIRTPHAIASVRGTVFAVEVTADGTAVFSAEGRVWVRRFGGIDSVVLSAGQGVDVAPGQPMIVRRWGAARAATLLARFGR